MNCKYCNKESNAGGIGSHEPYCKQNPDRKQRKKSKFACPKIGTAPWNKGLTGDPRLAVPEERKKYLSLVCSGRAKTEEAENARKKKIKEKSANNGGYRKGSGRSKHGWYKNIWCDSSWELAWVIYNLDHGLQFTRNTSAFEYEYEGKKRKYYPDFVVENSYIEIKGYFTEQTKAKVEQFSGNLVIIDKRGIQKHLTYARERYGKNFTELYDR